MSRSVLHFLVIGALLLAGQRTLEAARAQDAARQVTISAAHVERIAESWRRSMGRLPRPEELSAAVAADSGQTNRSGSLVPASRDNDR